MSVFSIKDIEAVSGIKSHTLRIWEQRYGIISPKRTDTNIRYYDDDDLKFIINISILNKQGMKISEIAKLSREQVNEAILKLTNQPQTSNSNSHVKSLVSAMLSYDEYEFHKILTTNIIQQGIEATMMNIIFPFLVEVGILWQVGSVHPANEHFATNIIKQKLYVAIDGNVGRFADRRKRFLLFLPEQEQHSIGLLFANYILRTRGHDVLYLGQEVPLLDLQDAFRDIKPDFILTQLTSAHVNLDKVKFVKELTDYWPSAEVLLAGMQFNQEEVFPERTRLIPNMAAFISLVDSLSTNQN